MGFGNTLSAGISINTGSLINILQNNIARSKPPPIDPITLSPVLYHNGDDLPASGAISQWINRATGNTYSTQATVPNQPSVATWVDGSHKCAQFNGSTTSLLNTDSGACNAVSFGINGIGPRTIWAVYQRLSTAYDHTIIAAGTTTTNGFVWRVNCSQPAEQQLSLFGTSGVAGANTPYSYPTIMRTKMSAVSHYSVVTTYDGGRITLSQQGVSPLAQATNPFPSVAIGAWSQYSPPFVYAQGKLRAIGIHPSVLTAQQILGINRFFGGQPTNIVCAGNSQVYGVNLAAAQSFPSQMDVLFNGTVNKDIWVVNLGVSGCSTIDMQRRYYRPQYPSSYNTQPQADSALDSSINLGEGAYRDEGRLNILIVHEVGNDLYNNGNQNQALANLAAYVARAIADGWVVITHTVTQRGVGEPWSSPGGQTQLQYNNSVNYINQTIVNNNGGAFGFVVDIASIMGSYTGANFQADQVHYTQAGNGHVANADHGAILAIQNAAQGASIATIQTAINSAVAGS